jgi:hypothetical protein
MNKYITKQTQINKRESLRCERDSLGGKPIIRILRLKPNASGRPRPVGYFEFAEPHLPSVTATLSKLASILEASR